jgi:hypothetical protein
MGGGGGGVKKNGSVKKTKKEKTTLGKIPILSENVFGKIKNVFGSRFWFPYQEHLP